MFVASHTRDQTHRRRAKPPGSLALRRPLYTALPGCSVCRCQGLRQPPAGSWQLGNRHRKAASWALSSEAGSEGSARAQGQRGVSSYLWPPVQKAKWTLARTVAKLIKTAPEIAEQRACWECGGLCLPTWTSDFYLSPDKPLSTMGRSP